jgi:hypothetical protein
MTATAEPRRRWFAGQQIIAEFSTEAVGTPDISHYIMDITPYIYTYYIKYYYIYIYYDIIYI